MFSLHKAFALRLSVRSLHNIVQSPPFTGVAHEGSALNGITFGPAFTNW